MFDSKKNLFLRVVNLFEETKKEDLSLKFIVNNDNPIL
jgi:hypothetical protein